MERKRYTGWDRFLDVNYQPKELKPQTNGQKPEVIYQAKISHKVTRDGKK